MLASLSSLLSVLPRITSAPALSAASLMPACTVCMNVSLWNTTPAIVNFLAPGAAAAVVGAGAAAAAVGAGAAAASVGAAAVVGAGCAAGAAGAGAGAAGAAQAVATIAT